MSKRARDESLDPTEQLFKALYQNNNDGIKEAIKNGATLDTTNEKLLSPLQWAIALTNVEGVDILLKARADPSFTVEPVMAPLLMEVGSFDPNEDIVKLLLDHGADLSIPELSDKNMAAKTSRLKKFHNSEEVLRLHEKIKSLIQRQRLWKERSHMVSFYEGHMQRDENGEIIPEKYDTEVEKYVFNPVALMEVASFIDGQGPQGGKRRKTRKARKGRKTRKLRLKCKANGKKKNYQTTRKV